MTLPVVVVGLVLLAGGCGPRVRTYQVEVSGEQVCRTFEPQPETCGRTNSPALVRQVTIEDRGAGRALIYGRTDSSADRVYVAQVPREGRYEVVEEATARDETTGCSTRRQTVVALDVDDQGLEGGEEYRVEEEKKCNDLGQRRTTRRMREWLGSRTDGDGALPALPGR
jgi:hypothetical protein